MLLETNTDVVGHSDSQYAELEKRAMTSDERARSKSELYTRLLTKQQVTGWLSCFARNYRFIRVVSTH